jgi:2-polyprenyl-6-methoxyphenol hydroxylase-like FAD-dependent oxidoreductase
LRALVVGGGIGGLAAGIALRVSWRPRRGLGLAANAVRALDRLGVADAVRARGLAADRLVALKPNSEPLNDLPLAGRAMLGLSCSAMSGL